MARVYCPDCQETLHWDTRLVQKQLVDVFICDRCGYTKASEDWHLPLEPPRRGTCRNCGGSRRSSVCSVCGLTTTEDAEVHDELRMLIDPEQDLLTCAGLAAEAGRKLIALKLATAAVHENGSKVARLLRVSLLQELGEIEVARSDCRWWTQEEPDNGTAWAVYGEVLLANLEHAEAMKAFLRSLALSPEDHLTRARLAERLLQAERFAQARENAECVLEKEREGEAREIALGVLIRYAQRLMQQGDAVAVQEVIDPLDLESNASLMAIESWLHWKAERVDEAHASLRKARNLDPEDELVEEVQKALGKKRRRWLPWGP